MYAVISVIQLEKYYTNINADKIKLIANINISDNFNCNLLGIYKKKNGLYCVYP